MRLQDHIEPISKIAEVAGKEYSIEQVCSSFLLYYSVSRSLINVAAHARGPTNPATILGLENDTNVVVIMSFILLFSFCL